LFTAGRGQWNDLGDSEFRGLLKTPLEVIELYDGEQKSHVQAWRAGRQRFYQCEFNRIPAGVLNAGEPKRLPITQLIKFAGLGAQHPAQVVGRLAAKGRGRALKPFDEEATSHWLARELGRFLAGSLLSGDPGRGSSC